MIPNFFNKTVNDTLIARIKSLTGESKGLRGKMNISQMLAHCCVPFEYEFESEKHSRPNWLTRKVISLFAKNQIVSEKPYPHNGQTSPDMIITDNRDFTIEQSRLIAFVTKAFQQGETHYEGFESWAFGELTSEQWSNSFYKHLDHHLSQFGV